MRMHVRHRWYMPGIAARSWLAAIAFSFCLCGGAAKAFAAGVARGPDEPLRVAVYDLAPYGFVDAEGLFSGASVDLWRRVAEDCTSTIASRRCRKWMLF